MNMDELSVDGTKKKKVESIVRTFIRNKRACGVDEVIVMEGEM